MIFYFKERRISSTKNIVSLNASSFMFFFQIWSYLTTFYELAAALKGHMY